ncbi:hypothetical protein JW998_09430 [candidate division KSB1 bacterium]|nr:hypothetical protein [candidate division KSB1 bacterium]
MSPNFLAKRYSINVCVFQFIISTFFILLTTTSFGIPDLEVGSAGVTVDNGNCDGRYVSVSSVTWTNQGDAFTTGYYCGLYLSTDSSITTDDILISYKHFDGLGASAQAAWTSIQVDLSYLSFSIAPGTYYVGAYVDYLNDIPESDESNNEDEDSNTITSAVPFPPDDFTFDVTFNEETCETSVTVSWEECDDAASYDLQRLECSDSLADWTAVVTGGSNTSYSEIFYSTSAVYSYRVRVNNSSDIPSIWRMGNHIIIGNGSSEIWYFADGYTEDIDGLTATTNDRYQTYVTVLNDQDTTTTADVWVYFEDEGKIQLWDDKAISPNSRKNVEFHNEFASIGRLTPQRFGIKLEASQPVYAERVMYWPSPVNVARNIFRTGATAALGATQTNTCWHLAEGTTINSTGDDRFTSVSILNPSTSDTTTTVTFLIQGSSVSTETKVYEIPAERRITVHCNTEVPAMNFSVYVNSSPEGVVVDRIMYGDAEDIINQWGHATLAQTVLSPEWYFGAGEMGGEHNMETFFTLSYPTDDINADDAVVDIHFLLTNDDPVTRTVKVAPNKRYTVICSQYPELANQQFASAFIVRENEQGLTPEIFVERPMYWRAGGFSRRSGASDTIGASTLATNWYMPEGAVFGYTSDFECKIAIGNPSDTEAEVEVVFVCDNGTSYTVTSQELSALELSAGHRTTVNARDYLGSSGSTVSFSTIVRVNTEETPDARIVADREMYGGVQYGAIWIPYYCGHASNAIPLP